MRCGLMIHKQPFLNLYRNSLIFNTDILRHFKPQ